MKIKHLILLTFIFSIVSQSLFAQTKHALIFAISNYPAGSGWPHISSENDVPLIQNALKAQSFTDIKVVQDEAATVKGISAALEDLIATSKPGDIDVVHFSTHGEQVEDLKRHKADGMEECIVAYDAKLPDPKVPYTKAYFESLLPGYYREDLFGTYVQRLREKLGKKGDLIVFIDCCHASLGTRGSAKIRGGKGALVSPGFSVKTIPSTDLANAFSSSDESKTDESNLATYVVFGAARADELDYESFDDITKKGYGSLSFALSKAFLNLTKDRNTDITYRSLFAMVQSIMDENASNQHPVLAGNGVDRALFGGNIITQKPYFEIDQISDNLLVVKGGNIMGLDSGAKVSVYPSGTHDPKSAKLIDTGTVVKSGLFNAEVKFSKPVTIKQPADGWVFVTAPVYKNNPLKISIAAKTRGSGTLSFSEQERIKILTQLKTLPGVAFTGAPELKVIKGAEADSIIIAQTGLLFDTIKSASADTAGLKTKIARYMQYTFLKSINVKDTDALVDIKLIPVINGRLDSARIKSKDKTYIFKNGDQFKLMITNTSSQDLYVNILDLQPDGQINPILPYAKRNLRAEELSFPAGSTKIINRLIKITPPYGKETFKIFVSPDLIDVESIANTRGVSSRGNLSVFEKLVQKSYGDHTRGVEVGTGDANGSAYNLAFDIVPKQ